MEQDPSLTREQKEAAWWEERGEWEALAREVTPAEEVVLPVDTTFDEGGPMSPAEAINLIAEANGWTPEQVKSLYGFTDPEQYLRVVENLGLAPEVTSVEDDGRRRRMP